MMKMYRCRICGETFLGSEAPSHCPFCGAHRELFVDTSEYPEDINAVDLTEVERNDLMEAIELELSNTRFYLAMAAYRDDLKLASAYKRLAKIEAEHCSIFCKLASVGKPADLMVPSDAPDDWCANIAESKLRETRASAFYGQVVARATNERIREVFAAVSAIEADHMLLDDLAAEMANC
ncbi:MAG: ferritin [Coriobacteriia bacterium]|nr:ferritin [Coriobacteriia bacterium]